MATYVTWPGGGGGGSTTALALKTTGADVGVDASPAPTGSGFILVTTGATTATWQAYTSLNLVNNLRFDSATNTTNTASVSSSGGGTTSEALVLGKDSTITVTGAGSANNCAVFGTNTVVSATTGTIANSVFVGQGHSCAAAATTTSGAVAIGSAITVAAGAANSITLGHSITNGTPNSLLIAPNGTPTFFCPDQATGAFLFHSISTANATGGAFNLTVAEILGGVVQFTGGSAKTVTLPDGSAMDAAVGITQNLWVGMSIMWFSRNTGTGTLTYSSGTGHSMLTPTTQNLTTVRLMISRRTGVNTWATLGTLN